MPAQGRLVQPVAGVHSRHPAHLRARYRAVERRFQAYLFKKRTTASVRV